jgi:hypothetical protein
MTSIITDRMAQFSPIGGSDRCTLCDIPASFELPIFNARIDITHKNIPTTAQEVPSRAAMKVKNGKLLLLSLRRRR